MSFPFPKNLSIVHQHLVNTKKRNLAQNDIAMLERETKQFDILNDDKLYAYMS